MNTEELRRVAEAATPGPWMWDSDPIKGDPLHRVRFRIVALGRTITQCYYSSGDEDAQPEAVHIATFNPKTAIELLDRLAALEAENAALKADAELTEAASDVLAERKRQISAEGWTIEHDDDHDDGALSAAASTYALAASDRLNPVRRGIEFGGGRRGPSTWPWSRDSWKYGTPRRMLVKAGALVLAEIERLDRAARSKT